MQAHFRPQHHLATAGKLYPRAWQSVDAVRTTADWPEWCFLPLTNALEIVRCDSPSLAAPLIMEDALRLATLAAWRVTQGIYRFDTEVYRGLLETSLGARLPGEVLLYLPEWGVYIETPWLTISGNTLHGAFASIEWSAARRASAISIVLDSEHALQPLLIPLDAESLYASLEGAIRAAGTARIVANDVEPVISLLLYLCSTNADLGDHRPLRPEPVKTKRGPRIYPPAQPDLVEVGYRLGGVIRAAREPLEKPVGGGTGNNLPPHIRRAHWHTYWLGPRDAERTPSVRWMPPIPVNMSDALPNMATIRKVK